MPALEKLSALLPAGGAPTVAGGSRAPAPAEGEVALLEWGGPGEFGTPEDQSQAELSTIGGFEEHKKRPKSNPPHFTFTEVRRQEVDYHLSVDDLNSWIQSNVHRLGGLDFVDGILPGVDVKIMMNCVFEGPKRVRGGLKREKSTAVLEGSGTFEPFVSRPDDDAEKQLYNFTFMRPDPWHKVVAVRPFPLRARE